MNCSIEWMKQMTRIMIISVLLLTGCSPGRVLTAQDFRQLSPAVEWVRSPGDRGGWLWAAFIPVPVRNQFDQTMLGDGYLSVVEFCPTPEGVTAYSYEKVCRTVSLKDGALLPPRPPGKTPGVRLAFRDVGKGCKEARLPNGLTLVLREGYNTLDGREGVAWFLLGADESSAVRVADSPSRPSSQATYHDLGGGRILLVFPEYIFCVDCTRRRPGTGMGKIVPAI